MHPDLIRELIKGEPTLLEEQEKAEKALKEAVCPKCGSASCTPSTLPDQLFLPDKPLPYIICKCSSCSVVFDHRDGKIIEEPGPETDE